MTNLRNTELRIRDINKLIGYKAQSIIWDKGSNKNSEWVFASIENELYRQKLLFWLNEKHIETNCDTVLILPSSDSIKRLTWGSFVTDLESYFIKNEFQLYDVELRWILEYQTQEIVRFGKFCAIN